MPTCEMAKTRLATRQWRKKSKNRNIQENKYVVKEFGVSDAETSETTCRHNEMLECAIHAESFTNYDWKGGRKKIINTHWK